MLVKWISSESNIPPLMAVSYHDGAKKRSLVAIFGLHLLIRWLRLFVWWVKKPHLTAMDRAWRMGYERGYREGYEKGRQDMHSEARRALGENT